MQVITNAQDQPIDYTQDVAGQVLQPGSSIELPGFAIDVELGSQVRYTFFTTIIGETLDGTNMCNGNSFLECTVGFGLDEVFPTDVPTPRPTITPFPTGAPNSTACEIASNIGCTVIKPSVNGVTCDSLGGGVTETCPGSEKLLTAFLEYDGSAGASVFVIIECDKSEYFAKSVDTGGTVTFDTRASDACEEATFTMYSGDPENGGDTLASSGALVACPGPWTLGNNILPGLKLASYASTTDGGASFDFNVLEAEIKIDYTAINTGGTPLTISSGSISAPSPFGSEEVSGATIAQRNRQILKTETKVVQLSGLTGQTLDFSMSLTGNSANEFAIPCQTSSSYQIKF